MFFYIGVLKNFTMLIVLTLSVFLSVNIIKKKLQHRYFHVNIAKFLGTFFL